MAGVRQRIRSFVSGVLIAVALIATAKNNHGFAEAQSPAALCVTSLITLSPCMAYVTSNDTTSLPSQRCCTALASVVQSSVVCLCQLFTTNIPFSVPINQTRALALPGACKVTTPPLSQCKAAAGGPAISPSVGGPNNDSPATGENAPSLSPTPSTSTTPTAESPNSNDSPSAIPPTTSTVGGSPNSNDPPSAIPPTTSTVGGTSPAGSEAPSTDSGVHFTPSAFITVFAAVLIASIVC